MNGADLGPLWAAGVVVAVLRAPSVLVAVRAVDALLAGGITGIEITYSTPNTAEAISELVRRFGTSIEWFSARPVAVGAEGELCPAPSMASSRREQLTAIAANFAAAFKRAQAVRL
jgi:2-keto-3-deoxy-6-phosphogluconate aldolase